MPSVPPDGAAVIGPGEAGPLPCLYRNNCTETPSTALSTAQKKSASALAWNVQAMAEKHGLERLGFLTLTFADHVLCPKESQRRLKSLRTHVLSQRYQDFIRVFERQKSGRIHYHLLVALTEDIRTGFDFQAAERKDYTSAGNALRSEWAFWRCTAPSYRFGRTELLPVKSTAEGIGRYVGKYISKHIDARETSDKGVRLVEYSSGARMATSRYAFVSEGSAAWRRKLAVFAESVGRAHGDPRRSFVMLSDRLGPSWAYKFRDFIMSLPDPA